MVEIKTAMELCDSFLRFPMNCSLYIKSSCRNHLMFITKFLKEKQFKSLNGHTFSNVFIFLKVNFNFKSHHQQWFAY